jgi:hypothetical protein
MVRSFNITSGIDRWGTLSGKKFKRTIECWTKSCIGIRPRRFFSNIYCESMMRGALIVLEGVDRAGKSTQCQKLVEHIRNSGVSLRLL